MKYQVSKIIFLMILVPTLSAADIVVAAPAAWATSPSIARINADGSSLGISDAAYPLIAERVSANRAGFYVYQDADSGFNHGFPSGLFGVLNKINIEAGCVDDFSATNGCSKDLSRLDQEQGTVLRISFDPLLPGEFAGVNIEEPENWGVHHTGKGYDLRGATHVAFEVRSPDDICVQFGVGGGTTEFMCIPQTWTSKSIDLSSLSSPPNLPEVHKLFTVVTNDINTADGGTVLIDNIRFEPVPTNQQDALGFPLSTETFGVVPLQTPAPGCVLFPPDQVNRNVTTVYEAALTLLALLEQGTDEDLENARLIADTFYYALHHDNHGNPLLPAPDGSVGFHSAHMSGDTALFNDQVPPKKGQEGDIRLAGFSAAHCAPSKFCLVLDGATGGNNAFAMLALAAAYEQFNDLRYLDDARTIGNWIVGNLTDNTGTGFGGYYLGYPDEGITPKHLLKSKSIENNADIFAAFKVLANIEKELGNDAEADQWTRRANVAGDFVMEMFNEDTGCFYAGTEPVGTPPGSGIDPSGEQRGEDVINVFDFLDSNTFTTLALATDPHYQGLIDWRNPVQCVLDKFDQSVTAAGNRFYGFNIVEQPVCGPNGIAWEFTGQAVVAMRFVDFLYEDPRFEKYADFYLSQIRKAQIMAPFGDGRGLVASTLQDGDLLPPHEHCLATPFQCIPQRVGLAATTWAIFAEQNVNPFFATSKLYVDWETGKDDDNYCTDSADPCKTIGHALDQAEDGDTILVAEGIYTENLVINKTVTLKGAYEADNWSRSLRHYTTTIDGNKSGPVIYVESILSETTVIDGFTITNGDGGISTLLSNLAVQNCQIVHNHATGSGGGMTIDHAFVTITNTIIADNTASDYDGGIRIISTIVIPGPNSEVSIINSTIANNRAEQGRHGIFCSLSFCIVVNSIVWGHEGEDFSGLGYQATYSDVEMCLSGEGNICEDPCFVDPDNGDYHLKACSPCIDAGTNDAPELPDKDFEGNPRIVDGNNDGTAIVDMGADEYILQPTPDIKANGSVGPVEIPVGSNLTVTISLDSGDYDSEDADWWLLVSTLSVWYHYDLIRGWQPGFSVTHQGPLTDLPASEVLNTSGLLPRTYNFYFGVDMDMNGSIDLDQLYYDSVEVTIMSRPALD
jgi:hypothetical protein